MRIYNLVKDNIDYIVQTDETNTISTYEQFTERKDKPFDFKFERAHPRDYLCLQKKKMNFRTGKLTREVEQYYTGELFEVGDTVSMSDIKSSRYGFSEDYKVKKILQISETDIEKLRKEASQFPKLYAV